MEIIVQKSILNNLLTGEVQTKADIIVIQNEKVLLNLKNITLDACNQRKLDDTMNHHYYGDYEYALDILKSMRNEFKSFKDTAEHQFVKRFQKLDPNYKLNLTYKGVKIPEPIVEKMESCQTDEEAARIHRFYLKCLDNPNAESVKDLFLFIKNSGLIITPSGNFVTFRRIRSKKAVADATLNHLRQLNELIGKGIANELYVVIENDKVVMASANDLDAKPIGEMLKEIGKNTRYTDNHTGTFDYRIGHTYVELNYDSNHNNTCSRGLHSGTIEYVNSQTFCGDTVVWCIVDPRKVVAVSDSASKIRSSELFIGGIIEGSIEDFVANTKSFAVDLENSDTDYEKRYEGRVIEYNTATQAPFVITDDDYEDDDDDYCNYYDQDEEDEIEEIYNENEKLHKENAQLKAMIAEIKNRLSIND